MASEADLKKAEEESFIRPVVVFKHSTRCGISTHVLHNMENDWKFLPEEVAFYYLDLLVYRPLSNLVAEKIGVMHQSPQAIVIKNGKVLVHASHSAATYDFIKSNM